MVGVLVVCEVVGVRWGPAVESQQAVVCRAAAAVGLQAKPFAELPSDEISAHGRVQNAVQKL